VTDTGLDALAGPAAEQRPCAERDSSPWHDRSLRPSERAAALLERMNYREKLAQLVGIWTGADPEGGGVAPHQADMTHQILEWQDVIKNGLGQITRPYGTAPVDPALGFRSLASETMGLRIGASLRSAGVHRGLAPVLDGAHAR